MQKRTFVPCSRSTWKNIKLNNNYYCFQIQKVFAIEGLCKVGSISKPMVKKPVQFLYFERIQTSIWEKCSKFTSVENNSSLQNSIWMYCNFFNATYQLFFFTLTPKYLEQLCRIVCAVPRKPKRINYRPNCLVAHGCVNIDFMVLVKFTIYISKLFIEIKIFITINSVE